MNHTTKVAGEFDNDLEDSIFKTSKEQEYTEDMEPDEDYNTSEDTIDADRSEYCNQYVIIIICKILNTNNT